MQPLAGIRVLDFSTLLPGPLATLLLAEAGAEVIKIERPGTGDEMRTYLPRFGADSVNFAMLNRGKRSVAIDLKEPGAIKRVMPLVKSADVIVEQFRPGVMDRLGLGYDTLSRDYPRLIYCSITGYGQSGARASTAAHDLNYAADTGMLALAAGADGAPVPPAALVADIGGGSYPAVLNILLALRERDRTGRGCKLDVAMADNLFAFMYWAIGDGLAADTWPAPGKALVTGGSPRYNVYRTRDDRFIAAAPLEERFWQTFCDVIGLPAAARDDARNPAATIRAVAARIREKEAADWRAAFAGKDLCCNVVASIQDALADPHFRERGLFDGKLTAEGKTITALPLPLAPQFRSDDPAGYPALGEANSLLEKKPEPRAAGHEPRVMHRLSDLNCGLLLVARGSQPVARSSWLVARSPELLMRALVIHQHGPLDNLKLETLPDPQPGPDDVLVDVHAASVNFPDLLVIAGTYQNLPPTPFVPGKDLAGTVAAVGANVSTLKPGDRVMAQIEFGAFAERAIVPSRNCHAMPAGMSFGEGAAMGLVYLTAHFALVERGDLKRGETVLVTGAAGGVGLATVQVAKALGAVVVAAVSSEEKAALARAGGADHVVRTDLPDLREGFRRQVFAAVGKSGVDLIVDTVGGDVFDASLRAIAWCGRLITAGYASGRVPEVKAGLLLVKNISLIGLQVSDYRDRTPEKFRQAQATLLALYAAGKLKPHVMVTYPLERFREALATVAERRALGKVVLDLNHGSTRN